MTDLMPYQPVGAPDATHRQGILTWRPAAGPEHPGPRAGLFPIGIGTERDGLMYRPPLVAEPTPLLVMLHGAGASASDVMPMVSSAAERFGVVVLAPDSRGGTWDFIRHGYGPDVAFLDRALHERFGSGSVDPGRIAVAGFSDGGSYALSLGLINGGLFSDILAFSPGFGAPTRMEDTPRIFISHGRQDPVLPIERCGRRLAKGMKQAGYDVDYHEFSGGHVVPADIVDAAFRRFLDHARADRS
jgi:phospholipase/carboxylesterase